MAKIVLIGAGPGAEDLITIRGLKHLQQADCIFYDALVSPDLLQHANPTATRIAVGKRCGKLSTAQQFINKQLIDATQKYKKIVRLKGGDPMVFGRSAEEIKALELAGHEVEVVPGVTAALAAASQLKTSLTLRGVARSVTFLTPSVGQNEAENHLELPYDKQTTLAVYMGFRQCKLWVKQLIEQGYPANTPLIVCESVSTPEERFTPFLLHQLPHLSNNTVGDGPCLILIGKALKETVHEILKQPQSIDAKIKHII